MAPPSTQPIWTYAAIGVAAASVILYVLGPSIFPVEDADDTHKSSRSRTVGLVNPANDCFINSVIQALAGLPQLSESLAKVEGLAQAQRDEDVDTRPGPQSMRDGRISSSLLALTRVLTKIPPSRKTTSAKDFLRTLEDVLQRRMSRQQQDAQEFLQIVLDQLWEEHKAVSQSASFPKTARPASNPASPGLDMESHSTGSWQDLTQSELGLSNSTFATRGQIDTIVQCQKCQYKPTPSSSPFLSLTMNVPEKSSATLDECLDGLLKSETIDDYKCAKCGLNYVLERRMRELSRAKDPQLQAELEDYQATLRKAIEQPDLEKLTHEMCLDHYELPTSRITKHSTISAHPDILVLHLSRSIFDVGVSSRKNAARVDYPELLRMGGFDKKMYKLMTLVTHKGGHNSGHYETFRRQHPDSHGLQIRRDIEAAGSRSTQITKALSKWWRISDDKIGQCYTKDVLAMNTEAYLLFYELQAAG